MPSHTAKEQEKKGGVNKQGFSQMPQSNPQKGTGPQGNGGAKGGASVAHTSNPKGTSPKKMGGGGMPLSQGPIQPKVGR